MLVDVTLLIYRVATKLKCIVLEGVVVLSDPGPGWSSSQQPHHLPRGPLQEPQEPRQQDWTEERSV